MTDPKRKRLFERDWKYVPASKTNIAKLFKRIRREQREAEAAKQSAPKITAIRQRKAAP